MAFTGAAFTPGYLALGRGYHAPDGNNRTRDIPSVDHKAACPDAPYRAVSLTTTMATGTVASTNKRRRIALACNLGTHAAYASRGAMDGALRARPLFDAFDLRASSSMMFIGIA